MVCFGFWTFNDCFWFFVKINMIENTAEQKKINTEHGFLNEDIKASDFDFVTSDYEKEYIPDFLKKAKEIPYKNGSIIIENFFLKKICKEELNKISFLEKYNVKSESLVYFEKRNNREVICVMSILYKEENEKKIQVGVFEFELFEKEQEKIMEIELRELYTGHKGSGLDLQCQIDEFCRKYNIKKQRNNAYSDEDEKMVGAYVWARYGYEFLDDKEKEEMITEFTNYIKLLEGRGQKFIKKNKNIKDIKTPRDIAEIIYTDDSGEDVYIGKDFLLAKNNNGRTIAWKGERDVSLKSKSTEVFIELLKSKNRDDLIKKHYPDIE